MYGVCIMAYVGSIHIYASTLTLEKREPDSATEPTVAYPILKCGIVLYTQH